MTPHTPCGQRDYEQPFNWWGYRTSPEQPMSITQLIDQGTLSSQIVSFLWIALEQRASIVVAATPQEAGKTTMLTALLDFLPKDIDLIYLRGWYERFEFVEEPRDPARTYLLSNEISSHLPIYMWGRGVRRLFEAAEAGFGMAATVHAENASEVIRLLEHYPLEVPRPLISNINLVVSLSYRKGKRSDLRRLMRLEVIENREGVPVPKSLASRDVISTELQVSPGLLINTLVRHFGLDRDSVTRDYAARVAYLDRLVRRRVFDLNDVRQAIEQYESASHARGSEK
jgi:hypothetical protein